MAILAIAAAALTVATLVAAPARAQDLQYYNIRAQALDGALIEFAEDAGVSLGFPADGLPDRQTRSLVGVMGVEDALNRLLADSGFAAQRTGDRAWRIAPVAPDPAAPSAPAAAPRPRETPPPAPQPFDRILVVARQPVALRSAARSAAQADAARLQQLGAHSASDLASEIGGLQFTNVGRGRNKALLRGVSGGAMTGRAQATTGIYFGDVRLTYAAPDPDLQLVDIRTVEVLRGPQGALYGAGAIGGVLRIEPNPPDLYDRFGTAYVSGESGSQGSDGGNLELTANAPIVAGRLALRGVYYDQQFGGWLQNPALGIEDINRTRRSGQRLTALARLTDNLELELRGLRQEIDSRDSQYLIVLPGGGLARPALVEPHYANFVEANGTLRWSVPFGDVASTTGYVSHDVGSRYDATGLFGALGLSTTQARPLDEEDRLRILVHETRVSSPAGAATSWFLGVFLSSGRNDRDVMLRDGPAPDFPDTAYKEDRNDHLSETALFGEATWTLAPTLTLSTGGRLLRYALRTDAEAEAGPVGDSFSGRIEKTGFAPDLRLAWRPAATLTLHVSASEGFRSPGFNTGGAGAVSFAGPTQPFRIYQGDTLWTYELGASWIAPDNAAALTVTAFRNRWSRIQTDELTSGDFLFTGNAGDSDGYGVEASGWWRVTPDLTLRANALVNEPELTAPAPSFPGLRDSVLPGTPELSGGASVHYEREISLLGRALTLSADLSGAWTGKSRLAFGTSGEVGGYATIGARIALAHDGWEAAIHGDNIFGAEGNTFSNGNPYQIARRTMITPLRPAVFGLSLRREF